MSIAMRTPYNIVITAAPSFPTTRPHVSLRHKTENIAILWGMDSRSFVYTLFQLLTRPGYLVRDYISGHRQVSFPPIKMLVIVSLFTFIIESLFHLENEILPLQTNVPEIDNVIKWFNDNKSWGTLFFQAFYILPTWVVFRFAPRYPRHTLPEGFFLQIFLSTLSLLLTGEIIVEHHLSLARRHLRGTTLHHLRDAARKLFDGKAFDVHTFELLTDAQTQCITDFLHIFLLILIIFGGKGTAFFVNKTDFLLFLHLENNH